MTKATFGLQNDLHEWSLALASPSETLRATHLNEVLPLLEAAEAAARRGAYVALMLSYEAAPAFDSALKTHELSCFPLAWATIHSHSSTFPKRSTAAYSVGDWTPQVTRAEYTEAITKIRELITEGHTYQVNYSFPMTARVIPIPELCNGKDFFLINSVRKWMRARLRNQS